MNNKKERKIFIKLIECISYLIVIMILFIASYQLFQQKKNIKSWGEIENTDEYSYIEISKMSEKFAYYETKNIGIHFVIETEKTGEWRTYLIAIDEKNYNKFKPIIDYSYERTNKKPKPIKVYGYPVIIEKDLKNMAIKNIKNFLPKENKIIITEENFEKYLTNSFLDTTKERKEYFSIILFFTLILMFIMIGLFLFTIFDKNIIISNKEKELEKKVKETKKRLNSEKKEKRRKYDI